MKPSDVDAVVRGYLEGAKWADAPEGSTARYTKAAEQQARTVCERFIRDAGPLADLAIGADGYSAERFGVDLWLTRCGHGAGYWDRDALEQPLEVPYTFKDRDGTPYTVGEREQCTLGDALSALAYGTHGAISPYAYPNLDCYRGRLTFCETIELQAKGAA